MDEKPKMTEEELRRLSGRAVRRVERESAKPDQFDLLALYVDQDLDLRQIGTEFGVSKDTARTWLLQAEIPLRSRGPRSSGSGGLASNDFWFRLADRHVTFRNMSSTRLPVVVQARIVALKEKVAELVERQDRDDSIGLIRKILDEADLLERLLSKFLAALHEEEAIRAEYNRRALESALRHAMGLPPSVEQTGKQ